MGWGRRLVRITVMDTVDASMLVSKPVPVAGEWYPPNGVIILEFGTIFRRSPQGVWYSTYPR